ncbi:MAG: hypothetical protein IKH22_03390 [Prevotella sp.]|nr:hypothetical protein [Prevotella sp.]
MKKKYIKPSAIVMPYTFECMQKENSGVANIPFAKENQFEFGEEDINDLWGDEEE